MAGAGEVVSIACSSMGPEFNSQEPYGASQPSTIRPGVPFCHAGRALYT